MKPKASDVYKEATRLGLRLIPRGDKLEVAPKSRLTPEFAAVLREHKAELLALLEVPDRDLENYYAAGLHLAKQVEAGEFDGASAATLASIVEHIRDFADPLCRRALIKLTATHKTNER
jgi:TubC N-terminal docking domain